jgi:transposase
MKDWLPGGDLAYFIGEMVDSLDLSEIERYYQVKEWGEGVRGKANSGQPAYHPKVMVGLLFYGYSLGTPSSRRIAWLCERDAGYRIVAANERPNFRTISEFRRIHLKALKGLFVQVLQMAREAGLVKLGHVALDGTKVKANASKHKAMSYERMGQKEAEYAQQVEELLEGAQRTDEAEDAEYGQDRRGDELPEELRFRQNRLKKIREAKQALEEAARQKAGAEGKLDERGEPKPTGRGRPPAQPPGTPEPKAQRNFTDADSKIMKMANGSFDQAYNCQAAVEAGSQIIVAADATDAPNDKQQVPPMAKQIKENLGEVPDQMSGDSGYYSEDNVAFLRQEGVDDYLCPDRLKHGERAPAVRGRVPKDLSFIDRVRRKLLLKKGRLIYGLRKETAEPVFGQIKHVRGLNQFLLRGLNKVQGEWSLWCTTHNVLKLWAAAKA